MDKISIVICTYNRSNYLYKCLYCLKEQLARNIEIIIVDDSSSDNTKKMIDTYYSDLNVKYIFNKKSNGYSSPAQARNIGWKNSDAKYICFTDPENLIPWTYLNKVYEYHTKNPDSVTCIKPIMLSEKQTSKLDNDSLFDNLDNLFKINFKSFNDEENIYIQNRKSWRDNHFSMMPRKALEEINGVNENFDKWGFEGIDLIERILKKGYQLYNFIEEEYFVFHQWHNINRNMKIAEKQRSEFGIKDCGKID